MPIYETQESRHLDLRNKLQQPPHKSAYEHLCTISAQWLRTFQAQGVPCGLRIHKCHGGAFLRAVLLLLNVLALYPRAAIVHVNVLVLDAMVVHEVHHFEIYGNHSNNIFLQIFAALEKKGGFTSILSLTAATVICG
jgi:hypothetical protein